MNFDQIDEALQTALMISGGATILVTTLQKTVDPLKEWADKTPGETDNKIVAGFAYALGLIGSILQAFKIVASALALRPLKDPKKQK